MELKEAFDIIDATLGMFRSIEEEVENGDLKEKFLLTPVYSSIDNVFDADKNTFELETISYYNFVDGDKKYKRYIVDIRPVCSCMINEWPSPKAKKIRKLLNEVLLQCVGLCEETLGAIINVALDEGYGYDKYMRTQDSRTLETVLLDTIHEMSHALGLTEYAEPGNQEEQIYINDDRIISEDVASQMDWIKATNNFDPDTISDLVKNVGRSKREKKIVIKAIYDAMSRTGELYKIPYHVDKLLDDLYRRFDKNHKGIMDAAYNESAETLNFDVMMKQAIEEYMASHTSTDADIDEIFADSPTDNIIDLNECPDRFDKSTLPEEFQTPEAEYIMQKLLKAGLLDANWQPVNLSIAERGYLADEISSRLRIKNKWKVLGRLWNENSETLRQGKNKAVDQTKTGFFIEKLKIILG